jgi:hypothetical protein
MTEPRPRARRQPKAAQRSDGAPGPQPLVVTARGLLVSCAGDSTSPGVGRAAAQYEPWDSCEPAWRPSVAPTAAPRLLPISTIPTEHIAERLILPSKLLLLLLLLLLPTARPLVLSVTGRDGPRPQDSSSCMGAVFAVRLTRPTPAKRIGIFTRKKIASTRPEPLCALLVAASRNHASRVVAVALVGTASPPSSPPPVAKYWSGARCLACQHTTSPTLAAYIARETN